MRAKNQALVVICPSEMAAAAPGRPSPSASGCAAARSATSVTAPVHIHAHIGVTPSRCPTNTPSAAFDAAKNGSPSARTLTYIRTSGAVSAGTCMRRSSGPASAVSATASAPPETKRAVTAAVAVRGRFSGSSAIPDAALATAVVTTTLTAKHISAANAKRLDDGANAAR